MPTVRRFPNLPDVPCRGEALGSPIHWLGLQWAVTADGVERRIGSGKAVGRPVSLSRGRRSRRKQTLIGDEGQHARLLT